MLCVLIRIASKTHNISFSIQKKKKKRKERKSLQIILNRQPGDFSKGPKNEFETAMVNEPSVFEPLRFYCITADARYLKH